MSSPYIGPPYFTILCRFFTLHCQYFTLQHQSPACQVPILDPFTLQYCVDSLLYIVNTLLYNTKALHVKSLYWTPLLYNTVSILYFTLSILYFTTPKSCMSSPYIGPLYFTILCRFFTLHCQYFTLQHQSPACQVPILDPFTLQYCVDSLLYIVNTLLYNTKALHVKSLYWTPLLYNTVTILYFTLSILYFTTPKPCMSSPYIGPLYFTILCTCRFFTLHCQYFTLQHQSPACQVPILDLFTLQYCVDSLLYIVNTLLYNTKVLHVKSLYWTPLLYNTVTIPIENGVNTIQYIILVN